MYLLSRVPAVLALGACAATIAACGGAGAPTRSAPPAHPEPAGRPAAAPRAQELLFFRRQYASIAMAPEVHVYADGSASVVVPNGGAGMLRAACRLSPATMAALRRETGALPRRDLAATSGHGDTFFVRANGHLAAAAQTSVPPSMRGIVRRLAAVIDDDRGRCHTVQRFGTP